MQARAHKRLKRTAVQHSEKRNFEEEIKKPERDGPREEYHR
jgi:hypothetical protein